MTIKHPAFADMAALRQLWQEAFGDSNAWLDSFFATAFSPDRCLTAWADGHLAAALYWLDCSCRGEKCAYLYAVATARSFRGHGICHSLMGQAHSLLRKQGYAMAVLVPGSESLFRFYSSMDYEIFGGMQELFHTATEASAPLRKVTATEYAQIRRSLLPDGGIVQEGPILDFLQTQAAFYAGDGFVLCAQKENGTLFVPELLGHADPGAILKALACREGTFRTPGDSPFAMWLPLKETQKPEYFAIALD